MTRRPDYGPAASAVAQFIQRLRSFEWFRFVERVSPLDERVERVDFHWVVSNGAFSGDAFGTILSRHEVAIEEEIRSSRREEFRSDVLAACRPDDLMNTPLNELRELTDERYGSDGSYYKDTFAWPHELVEPPSRIVNYAALEVMVSDLRPRGFHADLVANLEGGLWPMGWNGAFPGGRLICW
jgi:hypothetical protein